MAVAITCGYGGYLLPLLAAHSSFCCSQWHYPRRTIWRVTLWFNISLWLFMAYLLKWFQLNFIFISHVMGVINVIVAFFESLTHWGRVTYICIIKLSYHCSDNGLAPDRCQAIIWSNAGILLTGPWGKNSNEILIKIQQFLLKKMRLKMSSGKFWPFCLGLNVLKELKSCL